VALEIFVAKEMPAQLGRWTHLPPPPAATLAARVSETTAVAGASGGALALEFSCFSGFLVFSRFAFFSFFPALACSAPRGCMSVVDGAAL
jgi:hypothetical protein